MQFTFIMETSYLLPTHMPIGVSYSTSVVQIRLEYEYENNQFDPQYSLHLSTVMTGDEFNSRISKLNANIPSLGEDRSKLLKLYIFLCVLGLLIITITGIIDNRDPRFLILSMLLICSAFICLLVGNYLVTKRFEKYIRETLVQWNLEDCSKSLNYRMETLGELPSKKSYCIVIEFKW